MLNISNLSISRGGNSLLTEINMVVKPSILIQLLGPNGSGKTTLLRTISNLIRPDIGTITYYQDSDLNRREDYLKDLFYLSHKSMINDILTPYENIYLSSNMNNDFSKNKTNNNIKDEICEAMNFFDIAKVQDVPAYELSSGQKQKIKLVNLIVSNKKIWLLDEPFSNLDEKSILKLENIIANHLIKGGLCISATHTLCSIKIKQENYMISDSKLNRITKPEVLANNGVIYA